MADPVTRRCRGSRRATDGRGGWCVAAAPLLAFSRNVDDYIVLWLYREEREETEFSLPIMNTTRIGRPAPTHGRADRSRMCLEQISRGYGGYKSI